MTDEVRGRAGGLARAAKLALERKSEIGRKAAVARWGERPPKVSHAGNFRDEFGIDVECFVLDTPQKIAVISQTGMARALGMSPHGSRFPRFIATKGMQNAVGADLREKLDIPLKFQWSFGGAGVPPATTYGYDAEVLIEVCQAIMRASNEGELKGERHAKIVRQAQIIVGASAKNGIRTLVYALSGYNPSAEEVIAAFKLYIQDEARKYEPELPNELYMAWHRLYQIPVPVRGKPWHFKHLTVSHVYHPLAKSQGKILSLLRALKSNDGARQKKLFQFLNEVGARALRMHLGRVLEMAESSADKESYEKRIRDRFGNQHELNLILPSAPIASLPPSTLSNSPAPA